MAAIFNALFGTYREPEQQNTAPNSTEAEIKTANATESLHTSVVVDDVCVNSIISSEAQAHVTINNKVNIDNLISQLSTTHAQIDQYSRARSNEINEQVKKSITDVLANTQHQQEQLLLTANQRHLIIENEYKLQLQKAVEALDAVKAKTLADLERDLQARQQLIMSEAKQQIDAINNQANTDKLNSLVEAEELAKQNIANLTDQIVVSNEAEAQNLLQSTTTTIITSQVQTVENPQTIVTVPVTETVITTDNQNVTNVADNQMQVAVRRPSELVLVPKFPTKNEENVTALNSTNTGVLEPTAPPAASIADSANVET
ncbi:unnamed protein product [Rotaria sp. Silwood2]|nr:unnamed protein product [Rotaria sp. Silwood2]CAF2589496.1 unnamed protein product [Rotaria sp. Silwood2]CAF3001475.1 unnamed protein product [Rotaria sp. Silwood2]CAF3987869.1 unnamed protein product [Rotaria sp. Silwood2]CAF4105733.1 unnamed protein product [Rotaria sp. Silwood2]